MISDGDSDCIITDCKEGEDCIKVTNMPSYFEVSEPTLPQKMYFRDGIYENNCQIWNQHS